MRTNAAAPHSVLAAIALTAATTLTLTPQAGANPAGGRVVHGDASFLLDGKTLTVRQGSDKAIIHWDDFSVSLDELTRFVQPSSSAAALNRVTGSLPSQIDGALRANGKLVLVNPNGIVVGPQGRIDASSFIGSTLGLTDEDFLAGGDLTFRGSSDASVVNLGTINAVGGDVFLIGRHVENHGTVNAPDGTAGLAAGTEVLLKQSGDERVFVKPAGQGDGEKSGTGVDNSGTVAAAAAELKATGNLYALAVNNTGAVRATGATKRNGRVLLTAPGGHVRQAGHVSARNTAARAGGGVDVTAGKVTLTGSSTTDASGETAGGQVRVGGGFKGQDPEIANAVTTTVEAGASITADATDNTAGTRAGSVVVWADGTTTFAGTLSARALAPGASGGDAEVSGATHLRYTGTADLRGGDGGAYGDLLLDPGTIIVGGPFIDDPAYFDPGDLSAQLALSNVTLSTSSTPGNIDPQPLIRFEPGADLTWNTPTQLELDSGRSVVISAGASITNTGEGSIVIQAAGQAPASGVYNGVEINGALSTAGGRITVFGEGGPDGGIGVLVNAPVTAGTTETGRSSINIAGNGRGGSLSPGVRIAPGGSLNTTYGDISVFGNGGSTPEGEGQSPGIQLDRGAAITSGATGPDAGGVFLEGNGGNTPGAADNDGIALFGDSTITSVDAGITLRGTGSGFDASNSGGIFIESATVESTGTGNVELKGTASATGTDNNGIRLGYDFRNTANDGDPLPGFQPPRIATDTGELLIEGRSTTGTGLQIADPGSIESRAGGVTLLGRGDGAFDDILAPGGIDISQSAGSFTFDGRLVTTRLTTSPGDYAVDLSRGADIGSPLTFFNTGGVSINTVNNPGTALSVFGSITSTESPTTIAGLIQTPGAPVVFGDTELEGDTLVDINLPGDLPSDPDLPPGTPSQVAFAALTGSYSLGIDAGPGNDIAIGDLDFPVQLDILSGRDATVASGSAINLGPVNLAGDLQLAADNDILQNAPVMVGGLNAWANGGSIELLHPDNQIGRIHNLFSTGSIEVASLGPLPLEVVGGIQSNGGDVLVRARGGDLVLGQAAFVQSPSDVTLVTDHHFLNFSVQPQPVQAGRRILVYSASVEGAVLGNLEIDAVEVGKAFPEPPTATVGNLLIALNQELVEPGEPTGPGTPQRPRDRGRDRTNAGDDGPVDRFGLTPTERRQRVSRILSLLRNRAPGGSRRPEEDNPVNHAASRPALFVAQLDRRRSDPQHAPRAVPRPFFGAPFAGALFAGPGTDLPLSPSLGPVSFGPSGAFGTTDSVLPRDLLEGLGDAAVNELEDALLDN